MTMYRPDSNVTLRTYLAAELNGLATSWDLPTNFAKLENSPNWLKNRHRLWLENKIRPRPVRDAGFQVLPTVPTATRPLHRRLVARRCAVAVDWTPICVTFLRRTGTAPCRSDRLATIDAPFRRRMKLTSPLAHTTQSLPVTMLPTKNSLKSFKSVLARSDWRPVLFGSPVCTLGFDTRVRRSITGGAGLCSVSTSSRSVVSSWDRCLSVNSLWGVIERGEPRLMPVFS